MKKEKAQGRLESMESLSNDSVFQILDMESELIKTERFF
jgi:hypothetical protein